MEKNGNIYTLVPLSPGKVYEDKFKLKKANEAEQEFMKNNGEDVRSSENKVSNMCETSGGKVLTIRNRFEDFIKKKKTWGMPRVERSKGEKRKVCRTK
jgi:hypothetical protein